MDNLRVVNQRRAWSNAHAFDCALEEVPFDTWSVIGHWVEMLAQHILTYGEATTELSATNQAKAIIARIIFDERFDVRLARIGRR